MSNNNENRQNKNDMGRQIMDSLADGLKTGNFSGLNKAISDSLDQVVGDALDSTRQKMSEFQGSNYSEGTRTRAYQDRIKREHERRRAEEERRRKEQAERQRAEAERRKAAASVGKPVNAGYQPVRNALTIPGAFQPVGRVSSGACIIGGAVGMVFSGVEAIVKLVSQLFFAGSTAGWIMTGAIFAISLGFFTAGLYNRGLLERARRYAQICGAKMYTSVENLAASMGMKPRQVLRDIRRMLKKGFYPQGYIDDKATTLMLSNEVHDQYLLVEKQKKLAEEDIVEEASPASRESEIDAMIAEGMDSVRRLHALNDEIPGEVISRKLDELEQLLQDIFARVREHPEQLSRIHRLMDYYLPTMLKLVEAYAEYDRVSVPGPEIISAKAEIENTLDKINEAFKQLLNNLFQDSVWDVTSDAKVLETMMKQDGLA
ncbi:MAG: 5-bromo-4-chloroindolyl phosphate hydrolysis family protein [Lachnospiraceae bacterium]|nr:5-bromo-4-chloroindolyl phosphate hydrolysis family protein [Lachnospiraceae bacterium]